MDFTYNQYIDDILTGKIKACKKLKLAVKRHVRDLERAEGTYPYYFDDKKAQKAIMFFCLQVHTKGKLAGQFLRPEPWQQFVIAVLYGWRDKATGYRRFTKCYIQVARKNGKSFIAAGVGLYDLITEPGSEVVSAATKKEQAKIVFEDAKKTVEYSAPLKKYMHPLAHSITCGDGKMWALSADSNTQDGLNISCGIIDEYHAHKTDDLLNVIESSQGMRDQPLIFIITTAGHDLSNPCYEEYERCGKMLEGHKGFENDHYAAFIWELDKNDDIENPANWIKANPNLDLPGAVSSEKIASALLDAKQKPSKMPEFKTKRMNIWVNNAEVWIDHAHWLRCVKRFADKYLIGQRCWGGIDLSKRRDFTVATFYFWICIDEDKNRFKKVVKHFFYIPKEQIPIKMKTDAYLIEQWVKEGWITATPGETVDYNFLYSDIRSWSQDHDIVEMAYDRNLSELLIEPLSQDFTMVDFAQSITAMSEPSKDWERAVSDGEIIDNNPVMAWMVSCATTKEDANGNLKVVKPEANKTSKRIDGVITSIMANDRLAKAIADERANDYSIEQSIF